MQTVHAGKATPDSLVVAFQTAQAMTEAEAIRFYREHIGRGLFADEADLFQFVCDKLGVKVAWSHYVFKTDSWHEGRKNQG